MAGGKNGSAVMLCIPNPLSPLAGPVGGVNGPLFGVWLYG